MNKVATKMIVQLFVSMIISKGQIQIRDWRERRKLICFSFMLISPTSQSTRSMKWLKSHVPEDGSVFLSDVTSLYTALNVIGPKAKYLLAELSDENFNDFARMTCRVGPSKVIPEESQSNDCALGNRCRFCQSYLCNEINAHRRRWFRSLYSI